MLYKKNSAPALTDELFANPTSEYRCTPFWAWNCKLNQDLLDREIECMKEMGMGGFHMHSRTGMATPYLTDDFFKLVRGCVEKARKENMLAWLYDEDRWPSGAAGGIVTKDYRRRARHLLFTVKERADAMDFDTAYTTGAPYLIAVYDVVLDADGMLSSYKKIDANDIAQGRKWYAYLGTEGNNPWYNGQSYVDTLSKDAIDDFIHTTHDAYAKAVGDEFDKIVPAIFTDEPQFSRKQSFSYATDTNDVTLPWTPDLPKTFAAKYGYDICDKLPELFWELPDGQVSIARYHYHDHVCDRFTEAFADNCGNWCTEHNIKMTGHMMEEPTLLSQTSALGEAMRSYRRFGMPGIDMLCNNVELSTAKQAQSAVHQYGREGMLSELYGVTDWDADFRGYKFQGDWQAALGVTVRVPHLFWVSMEGEAKRDYPASIGYQSPWYKEYSYVEDHFARVNTALTRGKPHVRVGVLHPIESYWLHFGPRFMTESVRSQMENHFQSLIHWMLAGLVDFDFISESLLPEQYKPTEDKTLSVGVMKYDTILVPEPETIRSSSLAILKEFQAKGGKLVFIGSCPTLVDAKPSDEVRALYEASEHATFDCNSIMNATDDVRDVDIRGAGGGRTGNLLYQMRDDGDSRWLFIAHLDMNKNLFITKPQDIRIRIRGSYRPVLYNTLNGKTEPLSYEVKNGVTEICRRIFSSDSILLKLTPAEPAAIALPVTTLTQFGSVTLRHKVAFERTEPNVLLLDYAEYKWDNMTDYRPEEEILRLDNIVRHELGMPPRVGHIVQPWVNPPEKPDHKLYLRFTVPSEVTVDGAKLALERREDISILWNGEAVDAPADGYFTDESCKTVALPRIQRGVNILELVLPFGKQTNTEWCYLLGDFRVRLEGCEKTLIPDSDTIAFQSVTTQGLPFYGGNLIYRTTVDVPKDCTLFIKAGAYRGAAASVTVDGDRKAMLTYEPYSCLLPVKAGSHELTFTVYGNRFNCHGAVHNANPEDRWAGPGIWRTGDSKYQLGCISFEENAEDSVYYPSDRWSEEYRVHDLGMMTAPVITFLA